MLKIKNCPICERTFSDPAISFCLEDGSILSAPLTSKNTPSFHSPRLVDDEHETVVRPQQWDQRPEIRAELKHNAIKFGDLVSISFQRTLRLPDDGNVYPLPAGLGSFPIYKVSDFADRVPESWQVHGGVFIPMYQSEALWINFDAPDWRPHAVKIASGKINAVTGDAWNQRIDSERQDYVVIPDQPWIDGFKTGSGVVRQFVAMPLGEGYSVEGQLTGKEEVGGIQLIEFDSKPDIFPSKEPDLAYGASCEPDTLKSSIAQDDWEMGLAAGGKIKQQILPDEYGSQVWDEQRFSRVFVHIANSSMFRSITGLHRPERPITAAEYAERNIPWFEYYDEKKGDLPVQENLYSIKPIGLIKAIIYLANQRRYVIILFMETPKTLQQAVIFFNDPDNCLEYFVCKRWPNGVACPTCGREDVVFLAKQRKWQCKSVHARRQFSAKVGTIFEDSPLGLDKWLLAVWMITNCKNGVSSYEIHRQIGVTQKTAWFMIHRIRLAMTTGSFEKLSGEVECDETYVGGKGKNMHAKRKKEMGRTRGYEHKTGVMRMLQRGGKVKAKVITSSPVLRFSRVTLAAIGR